MIEIKNITKKYGDFTAIEDISFNVEKSSMLLLWANLVQAKQHF